MNQNSISTEFGTNSAAQVFVALAFAVGPMSGTATAIEKKFGFDEKKVVHPSPVTTGTRVINGDTEIESGSVAKIFDQSVGVNSQIDRPTTPLEEIVGEIRGWSLLSSNWDGEGAAGPQEASLREAVAFVKSLGFNISLPEPMLLSSGRAGLYWNDGNLYADLEFTGSGRVTYYIEHRESGKHKGFANFDSRQMPTVFLALLQA